MRFRRGGGGGGGVNLNTLIKSFKHRFEILSTAHWVSATGFRISLACLLGAAGFLLAVKDTKFRNFRYLNRLEDGDDSGERLLVVPGLENLGNNCFLNVILQALASCSYFQGFLRKIVEEYEEALEDGRVGSMPLALALDALLEELSTVQHEKAVLSPRKVMLAMVHHIPNFNLSSQQDAEEALFHILSSLRKEISEFYEMNRRSLTDLTALSSCRILMPKSSAVHSDQERWARNFLGPFDGVLGSILTCQSCSSQISADFQFFHSLYLPPVLLGGRSIMPGCSVEDCLMQFFAAEKLEGYFCSHCWHNMAIKYLSLSDKNEADIEKLSCCTEQDFCDCKNIPRVGELRWSNNLSHTLKQLQVARGPKILCLLLQRASVNVFSEPVKLQGHISFPLTLNLSRFVKNDFTIKDSQRNLQNRRPIKPYQQPLPYANYLNVQFDAKISNSFVADELVDRELAQTPYKVLGDSVVQAVQKESRLLENGYSSDIRPFSPTVIQPHVKIDATRKRVPSGQNNYSLVSVVEHFGTSGNGHYTVYRRTKANLKTEDFDELLVPSPVQWFCVSDSQVHSVSEKDVLSADATMLFYEKIPDEDGK